MAPAYSWFLALRYLLARRVSTLGIAGVAVAVWALIVVIAVFSGFIHEIRSHIRGATSDLILTGIRENCSYEELDEVIRKDPAVLSTAPRLQHYAILLPRGTIKRRVVMTAATGNVPTSNNFVSLIGIDPEREAETTEFRQWVARVDDPSHRVAEPDRPLHIPEYLHRLGMVRAGEETPETLLSTGPGLILGLRRIERGERMKGGQLVDLVTAQIDRDVDPEGVRTENVVRIKKTFVLGGGFETRYRKFDEMYAFIDIDELRTMLGQDPDSWDSIDVVSEVAIKLRPDADPLEAQKRLAHSTGEIAGGEIQTWEEQEAVFLGAVEHERAMMKIVLFAVMLVAAFLIYATLHMMVMQKVKDIGILTSLGAVPGGIAAIFLACAVVIGTIGCSLGLTAGLLSVHYLNDVNDWSLSNFGVALFPPRLYDLDQIPYRIEPAWIIQVMVAAFALSILVAYFPARRAARLHPVQALSYE